MDSRIEMRSYTRCKDLHYLSDFPRSYDVGARSLTVRLVEDDRVTELASVSALCTTPRVCVLTVVLVAQDPDDSRPRTPPRVGALVRSVLAKSALPYLREVIVHGVVEDSRHGVDLLNNGRVRMSSLPSSLHGLLPREHTPSGANVSIPTSIFGLFQRGICVLELDRLHLCREAVGSLFECRNIEQIRFGNITSNEWQTTTTGAAFGRALRRVSFTASTCHRLVSRVMSHVASGSGLVVEYIAESGNLDSGWASLFEHKLEGVASLRISCATLQAPSTVWEDIASTSIGELCLRRVHFFGGFTSFLSFFEKQTTVWCLRTTDCLNELDKTQLSSFFAAIGHGFVKWLSLSEVRANVAMEFAAHLPASQLEVANLEVDCWTEREQREIRRATLPAARDNASLGVIHDERRRATARDMGLRGLSLSTSAKCLADIGSEILDDDDKNLLLDYAFRNLGINPAAAPAGSNQWHE